MDCFGNHFKKYYWVSSRNHFKGSLETSSEVTPCILPENVPQIPSQIYPGIP